MAEGPKTHRGAWLVVSVALLTYVLAVFHRSSLAVAGLLASERFDISASQLASFVMLQLLVYAVMQIPVGLLIDRFGPRRVMLTGTIILILGQSTFAFADTYAVALGARVLVGLGDAMTFVCVLRLVAAWFAPRRVPLVTQIVGPVGQLGSVIAAAPMTWALGQFGWQRSYFFSALLGIVLAVAIVVAVRDEPGVRAKSGEPLSWANIRANLVASWGEPGTRLGFWVHFTTQFSAQMMGLLWGFPFLVRGEGQSEETAALLVTAMIFGAMAAGPVLGWFVGAHPFHRSTLAISVILGLVVVWTLVLLWPGDAPLWLLVLLVIVVGIGGPTAMVGFEFVRSFNPPHRLGTAMGIVNQGGFISALILVVAIGILLDVQTPGPSDAYTAEAFKVAMSFQYVLWGWGLFQIWRYRRLTRALVAAGAR